MKNVGTLLSTDLAGTRFLLVLNSSDFSTFCSYQTFIQIDIDILLYRSSDFLLACLSPNPIPANSYKTEKITIFHSFIVSLYSQFIIFSQNYSKVPSQHPNLKYLQIVKCSLVLCICGNCHSAQVPVKTASQSAGTHLVNMDIPCRGPIHTFIKPRYFFGFIST